MILLKVMGDYGRIYKNLICKGEEDMKKIKKVLSLAIAYMMLLTVLPITAFASESSKVAEIPQYLNYGGGYCFSASLYKDEALIEEFRTEKNPNYGLNNNYGNYEYNEYITKRVLNLVNGNSKVEIKNLDGYYYVRNRTTLSKKAVYECANFNDGYLFSYDFIFYCIIFFKSKLFNKTCYFFRTKSSHKFVF